MPIFTPETMAAAVKATLDTQTVPVPAGKRLVLFTGLTTEGAKVAVAVKVAHGWDVNVYASKVWEHKGAEAGLQLKGSF